MNLQLQRSFFARDTHLVGRELLGKLLVRRWRGNLLVSRISEVEAYVGENDKASHARFGPTTRNKVMYGPAGYSYIYLIYGMYHLLNIVTEHEGFPAALLIRQALPVENISGKINGPGKITRALNLTKTHNKINLTESESLFVTTDSFITKPEMIKTGPRVGIDYAGPDALLPWRYTLQLTQSE